MIRLDRWFDFAFKWEIKKQNLEDLEDVQKCEKKTSSNRLI